MAYVIGLLGRRLGEQEHHDTVLVALIENIGGRHDTLSRRDAPVLIDCHLHRISLGYQFTGILRLARGGRFSGTFFVVDGLGDRCQQQPDDRVDQVSGDVAPVGAGGAAALGKRAFSLGTHVHDQLACRNNAVGANRGRDVGQAALCAEQDLL